MEGAISESALVSTVGGVSASRRLHDAIGLVTIKLHSGERAGLSIADMTAITGLNRNQAIYLARILRKAGVAKASGRGRYARWFSCRVAPMHAEDGF